MRRRPSMRGDSHALGSTRNMFYKIRGWRRPAACALAKGVATLAAAAVFTGAGLYSIVRPGSSTTPLTAAQTTAMMAYSDPERDWALGSWSGLLKLPAAPDGLRLTYTVNRNIDGI